MSEISRRAYADMYGPTTGDRVRLGDTELWIEVEQDKTSYGEEVKFGGGKVIRDGMGQSQRTSKESVDVVITTIGESLRPILGLNLVVLLELEKPETLTSNPILISLSVPEQKPLQAKD